MNKEIVNKINNLLDNDPAFEGFEGTEFLNLLNNKTLKMIFIDLKKAKEDWMIGFWNRNLKK